MEKQSKACKYKSMPLYHNEICLQILELTLPETSSKTPLKIVLLSVGTYRFSVFYYLVSCPLYFHCYFHRHKYFVC